MPAQLTLAARVVLDALGFNREMRKAGQSVAGMDDRTRRANASARRFARGMGQVRVETEAAGNSFASARGKLLRYAGGFVGLGAARAALRGVLNASIRQEQALAQVEARLRSTGYAAGLTSGDLAGIAADLQDITTYGDEATLEMQALLLSFRNIDGGNIARATALTQDLAAALGQDLRSAALQLGKALDDPIIGLTALQRSGTTFSEVQKELIRSLVETGRKAEAQKLILDELAIQYGGSAEAARNTLGGALQALGNRFGDLTEVSSASTGALREHIDGLNAALKAVDASELHQSLGRIAEVAGYAAAAFGVVGATALLKWSAAAVKAQVSNAGLGASALSAAAKTDVARLRLAAGGAAARRYAGAVTIASKATHGLGRAMSLLAGPVGIVAFAAYSIYELANNVETAADRAESAADRLEAATKKNEALRRRLATDDPPEVAQAKTDLDRQREQVALAESRLAERLRAEREDTSQRGLFGPTSQRARNAAIESLRSALAHDQATLEKLADNVEQVEALRKRSEVLVTSAGGAPLNEAEITQTARAPLNEAEITQTGRAAQAISNLRAENKRLAGQTGLTREQVERANRAHERELELARTYPDASAAVIAALRKEYAERDRIISQQARAVALRERFSAAAITEDRDANLAALDDAGLDPAARLEAQAVIELEAERELQEQRLAIKRVYWDQELIERAGYRDREAQAEAEHQKALIQQNAAITLPGQQAVLQAGIDLTTKSGVQQVAAAAKIATAVTAAAAAQSKKAFKLHQAVSIGKALISTYTAAAAALEQGPYLGPPLAAAVTALGLIQVALISAQQPPRGFARGGVLDSPTFFSARNVPRGVAGEAGPEAILPLRRTRGGVLGVVAEGGGRSVVLNLTIAPTTNVSLADPAADGDALGDLVGAAAADTTYAVIVQESRPGGLLDFARR